MGWGRDGGKTGQSGTMCHDEPCRAVDRLVRFEEHLLGSMVQQVPCGTGVHKFNEHPSSPMVPSIPPALMVAGSISSGGKTFTKKLC